MNNRPTGEELLSTNRVTVATTARDLGMANETVADGMQLGVFPFGTAYQRPRGSWVYDIRSQALVEYNRCGRIDVEKIAETVAAKVLELLSNRFSGGAN